jgi:outer membrane protein OmpA-like peptidoglycan-associated protein
MRIAPFLLRSLPLALLLCGSNPAHAQVTIDLRALQPLGGAARPAGAPAPTPRPAPRPVPRAPEPARPLPLPPTPPGEAAAPAAETSATTATPKPAPAPTQAAPTQAAPTQAAPAAPAATATAAPTPAAPKRAAPTPPGTPPGAPAALPTMDAAAPALPQISPVAPPPPLAGAAPPPPPVSKSAGGGTEAQGTGMRVTFATGATDISPTTDSALQALAQKAKASGAHVNVTAYAAGVPQDPSTPRRLSLSRALAVRAALLAGGLDSAQIYVRALGAPPATDKAPPDRVDVDVEQPAGGRSTP